MSTIRIDGQLEIDPTRGVIYFHSASIAEAEKFGVTPLRICRLPRPISPPTVDHQIDITYMYGVSYNPNSRGQSLKLAEVAKVVEKYRRRHECPGDPALPPCEVCAFIRELDAALPAAKQQGIAEGGNEWNTDMSLMPWALTLLFLDPMDSDGMETVRLGLRDAAGKAVAWALLPTNSRSTS